MDISTVYIGNQVIAWNHPFADMWIRKKKKKERHENEIFCGIDWVKESDCAFSRHRS